MWCPSVLGADQTAWLQDKVRKRWVRLESKTRGKETKTAHFPLLSSPGRRPPTLLMQLLDGDKSLHQLWKGGGDGAPALYGFIQLMHLGVGGHDRAQREWLSEVHTGHFSRVGQD